MRKSGVLLPITSLPGKYGIGTLSKNAYVFLDQLKAAGQSYWQILPLGPTGYGDSPYQSFSTFAGNPYFIDFDDLFCEGLLPRDALDMCDDLFGSDPCSVDYYAQYIGRPQVLHLAYDDSASRLADQIDEFKKKHEGWIHDFALYMALKSANEMKSFHEWPDDLAHAPTIAYIRGSNQIV